MFRMKIVKSLAYLNAKKKLEMLKHFYAHFIVFFIANPLIILFSANVFSEGETNFTDWSIYVTLFFWGIGLISHALYVFFMLYIKNSFLKKWEQKKIKEFLEEERF